MFRLIGFIIIVTLNFLLRKRRVGYSSYGYINNGYSYNDFSDWIQSKIKLFLALRKVKPFLSKYNDSYSIKNNNVTLIYNYKRQSIASMNLTDRKQNYKVCWEDYKDNNYMMLSDTLLKNSFRETFNQICVLFNQNTTYEILLKFIQENYTVQIKENKANKFAEIPKKVDKVIYVDEYFSGKDAPKKLLDINSATLEELVELPGINIAMSKRIIKYREENNGFNSKKEFYEYLKIKEHFQRQLNNLIMVNPIEITPDKHQKTYDRNIKTDEDGDIIIDTLDLKPKQNENDRIIDI